MSVTHPPSYQFRRRPHSPAAGDFEAITVDVQSDRVRFSHVQENTNTQTIILWISAVLFMLLVVSVIPAMHLDLLGNALAVAIGLVALATVGIVVQARSRSTTIELSSSGIRIEQGTVVDRELSQISWADLKSVELEPVDPKDEHKGMRLEFMPNEGSPVHALPGVGVGDLNAVRQAVLKAHRGSKSTQP